MAQCEVSERETNPYARPENWQCYGITGHDDISPFGRRWCEDILPEGGEWWDGNGYTYGSSEDPENIFAMMAC